MIVAALDVHYQDDFKGDAAMVVCSDLSMSHSLFERVVSVDSIAEYESGELFKRELPCIEAVLGSRSDVEILIVDGYATLDPQGTPGLGAHAAAVFNIPVIGVAKSAYRTATHAKQVLRGESKRPLYVTTAGDLSEVDAAHAVATMGGPHRIPDALSRADRLARRLVAPRDTGRTSHV